MLQLLMPDVPTNLWFCIWDMGDQGTYYFFLFLHSHLKHSSHWPSVGSGNSYVLPMYQMSQNGHLKNETWVHWGCWIRMSFGQLCDVEKLCPEVSKIFFFSEWHKIATTTNLPFQGNLENCSISLSNLLLELQLFSGSGLSAVPLFDIDHGLFWLSAPLSTAHF